MLVDDHQVVRQGVRTLFAATPHITVTHDVTGAAAMGAARMSSLDVVLVEPALETASGWELVRHLCERRCPVVVFTRLKGASYVDEAIETGAKGYVLKHSGFETLVTAIEAAARGGMFLDPALSMPGAASPAAATGRELSVLRHSAMGHSNKDIADLLGITSKTVEQHKSAAMRKLGLSNRVQMLRYAAQSGWLRDI